MVWISLLCIGSMRIFQFYVAICEDLTRFLRHVVLLLLEFSPLESIGCQKSFVFALVSLFVCSTMEPHSCLFTPCFVSFLSGMFIVIGFIFRGIGYFCALLNNEHVGVFFFSPSFSLRVFLEC
ncbi:hypothetical protein M758_2G172200 [Ceratodon purpureus]|nr:hypothetical protein M758_2G172200 [Ceratodon purpureus]